VVGFASVRRVHSIHFGKYSARLIDDPLLRPAASSRSAPLTSLVTHPSRESFSQGCSCAPCLPAFTRCRGDKRARCGARSGWRLRRRHATLPTPRLAVCMAASRLEWRCRRSDGDTARCACGNAQGGKKGGGGNKVRKGDPSRSSSHGACARGNAERGEMECAPVVWVSCALL
jgi:hypothetical protein